MSFKLTRSMVLCKGKVVDKFHFQVDGNAIPPINKKPVKCLSKIFACSLRDTKVIINISFSLGLLLSRNMAYQAIIRSYGLFWCMRYEVVIAPTLHVTYTAS